jgi:glutamine amidotransferase/cyclase
VGQNLYSTELKDFKVEHFSEVFEKTKAEAALAAGIFHREEVPIEAVKSQMRDEGIETR